MLEKTTIALTASVLGLSLLVGACAGGLGAKKDNRSSALDKRFSEARSEKIAAVHEDNRDEIARCFEEAGGEEKMERVEYAEVELRLPSSGEPASIRLLEPDEHPDELNDCVEEVFSELTYGEARRGATFYQTLRFDTEADRLDFKEPVDAYRRWGLTGDEIDEVIHAEGEAINACYDEADERRDGEVTIAIAIDDEGYVSRVTPKRNTLESGAVEQCLVDLLVDLEFPEPRGGGVVVFDYPFPFDKDDGWLEKGVPGP